MRFRTSSRSGDFLDEWLDGCQLYKKPVARDASCLFRAIAEQALGSQSVHLEVRKLCITYMELHKDTMQAVLDRPVEQHIALLRDPAVPGGIPELTALAHVFKADVVVYEECGQRSVNVTTFSAPQPQRRLQLSCSHNHYDIVYSRRQEGTRAYCQALVYSSLYCGVLGMTDVESAVVAMLHDANANGLHRRDSTASSDPREICSLMERLGIGGEGGDKGALNPGAAACDTNTEEQKQGSVSDTRSAVQLLQQEVLPFPYRVAKALDPNIYRNIEYDSWHADKREHEIRQHACDGRGFQAGVKVLIRLSAVPDRAHLRQLRADHLRLRGRVVTNGEQTSRGTTAGEEGSDQTVEDSRDASLFADDGSHSGDRLNSDSGSVDVPSVGPVSTESSSDFYHGIIQNMAENEGPVNVYVEEIACRVDVPYTALEVVPPSPSGSRQHWGVSFANQHSSTYKPQLGYQHKQQHADYGRGKRRIRTNSINGMVRLPLALMQPTATDAHQDRCSSSSGSSAQHPDACNNGETSVVHVACGAAESPVSGPVDGAVFDTPGTNCSTPGANCSTPGTNCSILSANCSTPGANCSTPGANCSTPGANFSTPGANCGTLSANCSTLSANCSTPGANCSTPGTNCSAPGTNCSALVTPCNAPGTHCNALGTHCSVLDVPCSAPDAPRSIAGSHHHVSPPPLHAAPSCVAGTAAAVVVAAAAAPDTNSLPQQQQQRGDVSSVVVVSAALESSEVPKEDRGAPAGVQAGAYSLDPSQVPTTATEETGTDSDAGTSVPEGVQHQHKEPLHHKQQQQAYRTGPMLPRGGFLRPPFYGPCRPTGPGDFVPMFSGGPPPPPDYFPPVHGYCRPFGPPHQYGGPRRSAPPYRAGRGMAPGQYHNNYHNNGKHFSDSGKNYRDVSMNYTDVGKNYYDARRNYDDKSHNNIGTGPNNNNNNSGPGQNNKGNYSSNSLRRDGSNSCYSSAGNGSNNTANSNSNNSSSSAYHTYNSSTSGSSYSNTGSYNQSGSSYMNHGPVYSNVDPSYSNTDPSFSNAGPSFCNAGPSYYNAGSTYSSAGPNYSNTGPSYSNAGPNCSNTGPSYRKTGNSYPSSGNCFPNPGSVQTNTSSEYSSTAALTNSSGYSRGDKESRRGGYSSRGGASWGGSRQATQHCAGPGPGQQRSLPPRLLQRRGSSTGPCPLPAPLPPHSVTRPPLAHYPLSVPPPAGPASSEPAQSQSDPQHTPSKKYSEGDGALLTSSAAAVTETASLVTAVSSSSSSCGGGVVVAPVTTSTTSVTATVSTRVITTSAADTNSIGVSSVSSVGASSSFSTTCIVSTTTTTTTTTTSSSKSPGCAPSSLARYSGYVRNRFEGQPLLSFTPNQAWALSQHMQAAVAASGPGLLPHYPGEDGLVHVYPAYPYPTPGAAFLSPPIAYSAASTPFQSPATAYATSTPNYPSPVPNYPASTPAYSISTSSYPGSTPAYHPPTLAYPVSTPTGPTSAPVYPTSVPTYPVPNSTYPVPPNSSATFSAGVHPTDCAEPLYCCPAPAMMCCPPPSAPQWIPCPPAGYPVMGAPAGAPVLGYGPYPVVYPYEQPHYAHQ